MNCPKCKENNPNSAYYCHNCGKKLRTKINGWLICSIILFLSTIIMGIGSIYYIDESHHFSEENYDMLCRIHMMTNQIQEKDEQISILESKAAETEQLQNRVDYLTRQFDEQIEEIKRIETLSDSNNQLQKQIDYQARQINAKTEELERLKASSNNIYSQLQKRIDYLTEQLDNKNERIKDLEKEMPQLYTTKYNNQYVYGFYGGSFEKTIWYIPEKESFVLVYTISNGYGLTKHGWIPMSCLKKFF